MNVRLAAAAGLQEFSTTTTGTVLVTGASSGIGAAIAEAFGTLGWPVALGARRVDRLEELARSIGETGGRALARHLDVSDPPSIDAFFSAAENEFGPIDVVVNNAAIGVPGFLQDLSPAEIEAELRTNLLGPMLIARRALPSMVARRSGSLVFISSMSAVEPRPMQAGYTAAKMGLEGVARTLRMDLEGTGVRSIIVRPGPTRSEFGLGWDGQRLMQVVEAWQRWGFLRHNEMLDPEQVAAAVVRAVTAPPGMGTDVVQLTPEAPVGA